LSVLVERFGERAVVLSTGESSSIEIQRRLWQIARLARAWDEISDVVCGDGNLTVFVGDPDRADFHRIASQMLEAWETQRDVGIEESRLVEIPVCYGGDDGPDLAEVAAHAGLSERNVVELHAGGVYVALFVGFLPGFAYLGGLDSRLALARRGVPRARVAAGAVAIGGALTAVYPFASPGGWNVIGRTEAVMFDARRSPAAAIAPGDRVRFVAIG
jgi:5-oxoprolinase (ATP-hydrolysing) subunit B